MELDNEKIARFLAELRKRNNLSQTDLADVLGVSERTVGRWEKGSALPTMNDVVNIVNYFGISLEEVFSGQEGVPNFRTKASRPVSMMVKSEKLSLSLKYSLKGSFTS